MPWLVGYHSLFIIVFISGIKGGEPCIFEDSFLQKLNKTVNCGEEPFPFSALQQILQLVWNTLFLDASKPFYGCLAPFCVSQVRSLISCKSSIKCVIAMLIKPEPQKGKTGWQQWLSTTCTWVTTWGYRFTDPLLSGYWGKQPQPRFSLLPANGCRWGIPQENCQLGEQRWAGVPPLTSTLQRPSRWAPRV